MKEHSTDTAGAFCPLPLNANLRRRYAIKNVISAGACSVTYDAFDYIARQNVVVKEYFPRQLALRAEGSDAVSPRNKDCGALYFLGSEAFMRQYGALTQAIGNANIVSVFEAFFENGTAYAVMEKLYGVTLASYLAMHRRPLRLGELARIAPALGDALLIVHSLSILHHSICMDSVYLCLDGTVKLFSFGAARQTLRARHELSEDEPWRDVQALGRTLYEACTGKAPEDGGTAKSAELPAALSGMLTRMTTDDPAQRFASVFDFRHAVVSLDLEPEPFDLTQERIMAYSVEQAELAQRERRLQAAHNRKRERERVRLARRGRLLALLGAALLLIIVLAAIFAGQCR